MIEIVPQSGHLLLLSEIAFSPDGNFVVTASADETLRLWDLQPGFEVRTYSGHTGPVYCVQFSPDGSMLASGSYDKTMRLWSVETGAELFSYGTKLPVSQVIFSVDGQTLLIRTMAWQGQGLVIAAIDLASRQLRYSVQFVGESGDVALDPTGRFFAVYKMNMGPASNFSVLSADIVVYEFATGQEWAQFSCPPIGFTASSAADESPHRSPRSLCFSPDGRLLVATHPLAPMLVYEVEAKLRRENLERAGQFAGLTIRPDNIVYYHRDGRTELARWPSFEAVGTIDHIVGAFSQDWRLFAVTDGKLFSLYDTASRQLIRTLGSGLGFTDSIGNLHVVFPLAVNSAFPILANGAPDGLIRLWDLRADRILTIIEAHEDFINALTFSHNGTMLASLAGRDFAVWDIVNGKNIVRHKFNFTVDRIAFATQFNRVVVTGEEVGVYDLDQRAFFSFEKIDKHFGHAGLIKTWPQGFEAYLDHKIVRYSYDGRRFGEQPTTNTTTQFIAVLTHPDTGVIFVLSQDKWRTGMFDAFVSNDSYKDVYNSAIVFDQDQHTIRGAFPFLKSAALHPDGRFLAAGSANGTLYLWDLTDRDAPPRNWVAHGGGVTGVGYVSDGRLLASMGMDGVLRFWDADTHELTATFLSTNATDYVMVSAAGDYFASKAGLKSIAFRRGNEAIPFDQFDLALNRPDRLHASLGYAYQDTIDGFEEAYRRRVRRMGLKPEAVSLQLELPQLDVLRAPEALATTERELTIALRARPAGAPIRSVLAYVNGVAVPAPAWRETARTAEAVEFEGRIQLSAGDNQIQLSALDEAGTESYRETYRVRYVGPAEKPVCYMLSIGVSDYRLEQLRLRYAAKDARDLADMLDAQQRSFAKLEAKVLRDAAASRAGILAATDFLRHSGPDDQIVLYLAGHGMLRGSEYYFLPQDFEPAQFEQTALSYQQLESLFDGVAARRRLVMLDTCHAGEFDDDAPPPSPGEFDDDAPPPSPGETPPTGARGATLVRSFRGVGFDDNNAGIAEEPPRPTRRFSGPLTELFADLRRESGAFVIAASGAEEYAIESSSIRNGVFTYAVMEAIRQAGAEKNLSVSALHDFVVAQVHTLTQGRQRPMSRRENLIFDFSIL